MYSRKINEHNIAHESIQFDFKLSKTFNVTFLPLLLTYTKYDNKIW